MRTLLLRFRGRGLAAVTLGNNLLAALPPKLTQYQTSLRWRVITRTAVTVPALLIALFVYQLSFVIQFTGLSGKGCLGRCVGRRRSIANAWLCRLYRPDGRL